MPRFPKARKRPNNTPSFLVTARSFYGEAFGPRRKADLAESMADWAELSEEEQSFALAHLQYLNLVAQAGTQRLLLQLRELLEEIEEGVGEALDEVEADEPEPAMTGDDELAGFDDDYEEPDVDFPELPASPDGPVPEADDGESGEEVEGDDDEDLDAEGGGS